MNTLRTSNYIFMRVFVMSYCTESWRANSYVNITCFVVQTYILIQTILVEMKVDVFIIVSTISVTLCRLVFNKLDKEHFFVSHRVWWIQIHSTEVQQQISFKKIFLLYSWVEQKSFLENLLAVCLSD